MEPLERELKVYENLLPELADKEGKFAVIGDEKLVGVFDTYEDALKAGYAEFGVKPFLVQEIAKELQVAYFCRDIGVPCPA